MRRSGFGETDGPSSIESLQRPSLSHAEAVMEIRALASIFNWSKLEVAAVVRFVERWTLNPDEAEWLISAIGHDGPKPPKLMGLLNTPGRPICRSALGRAVDRLRLHQQCRSVNQHAPDSPSSTIPPVSVASAAVASIAQRSSC